MCPVGIIGNKGVNGAARVKKKRYWMHYIDDEEIKASFNDKDIGAMGKLYCEIVNVPLHVFATKREDYVMMLMSTYGENERVGDDKFRTTGGEWISFKYPENMHIHYYHIDTVKSQNTRRQTYIALEETWYIGRLENHVFAFLLALSEINNNLGEHHFGDVEAIRPMLEFRRLISRYLINNPYLRQDGIKKEGCKSKRKKHTHGHSSTKLSTGKKINGKRCIISKSKHPINYCACRL